MNRTVQVNSADSVLSGDLSLPDGARGLVIFAHGSGSSRHSPRNRRVARRINDDGLGTLLMDLLTEDEERIDSVATEMRFDIELLARRVAGVVGWCGQHRELTDLAVGLFGSSTGAAAALRAAAELPPGTVRAVVSRGGRPDLAGRALPRVSCPTLLIVGGRDEAVIGMNEEARERMTCPVEMAIVPGASHLFEEPGALDEVAGLAAAWFARHLLPTVVA